MNYYYDVLLNFQDNYYMFYEWDENDFIEYIKKIPLIHIDNKVFIDLYTKIVKFDLDFLKLIKNKTKLKHNKYLKYSAIFSDGKNSIALELNDDGLVINKSSLILEDELNINEFMYSISITDLNYQIISESKINKETRQELLIKKVLRLEVEGMYNNKEYSKLKYIYLEWFNELLDNPLIMYKNMLDKIDSDLTEKEYRIYKLIKMSYNNV